MSFILIFFLFYSKAFAQERLPEVGLQTHFEISSTSLTSESANALDPQLSNPHLRNWLLKREVNIQGLSAVKKSNRKYGVQILGLVSRETGYLRPPGPWYQKIDQFPCQEEPDIFFSTQEGARQSLKEADELWAQILRDEKIKLSYLLKKVQADLAPLALEEGLEVYLHWFHQVDSMWRDQVSNKMRRREWDSYLELAKENQFCKKKPPRFIEKGLLLWDKMTPLNHPTPLPMTSLLARAPVKLWNGLFSIRAAIKIGKKVLVGRFLVDTGAPKSILSPSWLESQGILPPLVQVPQTAPGRIRWSMSGKGEGALVPLAVIDQVEVGGQPLALKEFLLFETSELFTPPQFVGNCCDGVLGVDFLKNYPFEFQSSAPAELRIWPVEGFQGLKDQNLWIELSQNRLGELNSQCTITSSSSSKKNSLKNDRLQMLGVLWQTGNEIPLSIHYPWQGKAMAVGKSGWDIYCDDFVNISPPLKADYPVDTSTRSFDSNGEKIPAVTIGMPILSRGNFTIDLPHGRLWFDPGSLKKQLPPQNHSGLILSYAMKRGERILLVRQVHQNTPALALWKLGLRPGMQVLAIDAKDPVDLDLFEVNQRLAGYFGNQVSLVWATKKGPKLAQFLLK